MISPKEIGCALETSIENAVSGKEIAIAFSGGLDSGLIAHISKKFAEKTNLYVVGFEESHDVKESIKTAETLGLPLTVIEPENLEGNMKELIRLTGEKNPVQVSFEIPYWYVCKNCSEEIILTGQGADELFAGYDKYFDKTKSEFVETRTKDLDNLFLKTSIREKKIAEYFSKKQFCPYISPEMIRIMMNVEPESLAPKTMGKELLRETAKIFGLDELAAKKKKAAQYGSGIMNRLKKEAKKNNISLKELMENLSDD